MLRTGDEYRESLRDGRNVWIDGERVNDVTTHPAFKPLVDVRARMYDVTYSGQHADILNYIDEDVSANEVLD